MLGEGAGDRVPMEKVVMLIWQFRDDPTVVGFMARFMAKVRRNKKHIYCWCSSGFCYYFASIRRAMSFFFFFVSLLSSHRVVLLTRNLFLLTLVF